MVVVGDEGDEGPPASPIIESTGWLPRQSSNGALHSPPHGHLHGHTQRASNHQNSPQRRWQPNLLATSEAAAPKTDLIPEIASAGGTLVQRKVCVAMLPSSGAEVERMRASERERWREKSSSAFAASGQELEKLQRTVNRGVGNVLQAAGRGLDSLKHRNCRNFVEGGAF
jgi:hypothetical protein